MKIKKTAIILCGGSNKRMNYKPKGLLVYNNMNFLEIALCAVRDFEEIIISCRDGKLFEKYKDQAKIVEDKYEGVGPIVGICSALKEATFDRAIVISCDMPLLNRMDINHMASQIFNEGALLPMVNGKIQSLCAMYNKSVIPYIEEQIENKDYKIRNLFKNISIRYFFPKNQEMFLSIDTVEDYMNLRRSEEA